MSFIPAELIKKKRNGFSHTQTEVQWLIENYTNNTVTAEQMSAWAMAVYFKGLNKEETSWLTKYMLESGHVMNFKHLPYRIDKHSTGGVGDKTSLLIGPILAAAEVYDPMIGGRGLGHTGGTLDKFESIPGFKVDLTVEEFQRNVEKNYFSIMSQTKDICPTDKKLYGLRDITGTVESLPLICGSIMSKKLSEDLTGLVLDIKCGSGAFMKTLEDAEKLAELLMSTGESQGVKVHALITNMNEVLGHSAGNALEVKECWEILCGKTKQIGKHDFYETSRELSLALSGHAIYLANKAKTPEEGIALARELLSSGKAKQCFEKLLEYQGPANIENLPQAEQTEEFLAPDTGIIGAMDTESLGLANIELGTGRKRASDSVDPSAGIEMLFRVGDHVEKGQALVRLYASNTSKLTAAKAFIEKSISFQTQKPLPLILKVLT